MEDTTLRSCRDFSDLIASKEPVPGGGGVSAAVGSFAAALADMVGNFTVGKKKFLPVEDEIKEIMDEADVIRRRLLDLVKADAEGFEPLSRAYSIPADDPKRDEIMEACLKQAVQSPMEMTRLCARCIELFEMLADGKSSAVIISDTATGIILASAALQGAAVNVRVNTKLMKDRAYADALNDETAALLKARCAAAQRVYDEISKRYE